MKTIKIEDIAIKFGFIQGLSIMSNTQTIEQKFNEYSLELCRQILELAAENACGNHCTDYVDKDSIKDTINQIEL